MEISSFTELYISLSNFNKNKSGELTAVLVNDIDNIVTYAFYTKNNIINKKMTTLRSWWEYPSYDLEKEQCNINSVEEEKQIYEQMKIPQYKYKEK